MSFKDARRSNEFADTEKSSPSPPETVPEEAQEDEVRKITGVRVSKKVQIRQILC